MATTQGDPAVPREGVATVPGVQSLERGLAVIRAFDADHGQMTLADVARRTELTRATVRRFLHTFVALGYMETDGRHFSLRPKILELGYAYLSSLSLPDLAAPHLKELSERLHQSSSVAVLDGTEAVYVARIPARRIMTVGITVGTRFPAHATSLGRVLLAGLPEPELRATLDAVTFEPITPRTVVDRETLLDKLDDVRRQGYALVDQELEIGLRSISVGIHDRAGEVVAAMNISMPATAGSIDHLRRQALPELQLARDAIERDLSSRPAGAL